MTEEEQVRQLTQEFMSSQKVSSLIDRAQNFPKEFPRDFLKLCALLGFLGMDIPFEYSGNKMSALMQAAATEEFARAHAGLGLSILVANSLTAYPIAKFGTKEQKEQYLEKMANGEIFGCFAITEPNVGSDAKAIEMKAITDGNGFRIRGRKRFITNANGSDICVFNARTGTQESREKGISAFVAEIKNIPEVSVPTVYDKVGQPGSALCEIVFDDFFVSEDNLLGELNNGFNTVIAGTLAHSRVQIAAQGVGIAQSALDEAEKYAETRIQFGKYLKNIPGWGNHFEVLKRQVELSRLLTKKAAMQEDSGNPNFFVGASLAKLVAGETAISTSTDCMLLHGGMGYIKDMGISQIVQDALVIRIYEGTSHIQTKILENHGIARKKLIPLLPPKAAVLIKPEDLEPLDQVRGKIAGWKIKPCKGSCCKE